MKGLWDSLSIGLTPLFRVYLSEPPVLFFDGQFQMEHYKPFVNGLYVIIFFLTLKTVDFRIDNGSS